MIIRYFSVAICFCLLISISGYGQTAAKSGETIIGKLVWSTQNLNTDKFRNGDPIPMAHSTEEWTRACEKNQPICCYYEFDESNGSVYGKLYNWFAVNDRRGLAPAGWHVPSNAEWNQMYNVLGGESEEPGDKLKAEGKWKLDDSYNNETGFSALPGGDCNMDGIGHGKEDFIFWWSSSANNDLSAYEYYLWTKSPKLKNEYTSNCMGAYVRCVRPCATTDLNSLSVYKSTLKNSEKYLRDAGKSSNGTIKIGNQTWMSANLNVDHFRNGDPIPEAKSVAEWQAAKDSQRPVWCYFNFSASNAGKYGRYYNWYAVNDERGLAPEGWHIPTIEEATLMADSLRGKEYAGRKMKTTYGWRNAFGYGNGSNTSGFSGLPGGYCYEEGWEMSGAYGYWWTVDEYDNYTSMDFVLGYDFFDISFGNSSKSSCIFVRCVKD